MKPEITADSGKAGTEESAFSFAPDFSMELEMLEKGHLIIAGIDEAGRGALAGPLSVGCTVYAADFIRNPDGAIFSTVNDSKLLTPSRRNLALQYIRRHSLFWKAQMVSHSTVDRLNINGATEYAIKKLLADMPHKPDIILLDGNFSFDLGIPSISVKKGDRRSLSIASASIAAKVTRDGIMERFAEIYPGYDFDASKGYGTLRHREALEKSGGCPIHRRSYEPLKSLLSQRDRQKR
jgi:ribonuclease HII